MGYYAPALPFLNQGPNNNNAQAFYPVAWRIHVGNLPRDMSPEKVLEGLQQIFRPCGPCFITLRLQQAYPCVFVQFTAHDDMVRALGLDRRCQLGGRVLRIEAARGPRNEPKYGIVREAAL